MKRLPRTNVVIRTNGQNCWHERVNTPEGIWVSSESVCELEHESNRQELLIAKQTTAIAKLHAELNIALGKVTDAYSILEAAHPIVAKSDQALRGQINYVLYKRPEKWEDKAEPIIHSSLGDKLDEPFMIPVDRSYVKSLETEHQKELLSQHDEAALKKISELEFEIEKWKEEYLATEKARAEFENSAVLNQKENVRLKMEINELRNKLARETKINCDIRCNLKNADAANENLKATCDRRLEQITKNEKQIESLLNEVTQAEVKCGELLRKQEIEFKVKCLQAEGKSTVMTADELDKYDPMERLKELSHRDVTDFRVIPLERYNELEGKFVTASELLRRVASGESYYPTLEKDIYKFIKTELRRNDTPAPNLAVRLLGEIAMGRKNWSYESFNAWFVKVDDFFKNHTIITEEMLRGELESLRMYTNLSYPLLREMKMWLDQRGDLQERLGGPPIKTPLSTKVQELFVKFPLNPVNS